MTYRNFIGLLAAATLAACAITIDNAPRNEPLPAVPDASRAPPRDIVGENAIGLAFSGGGYRAAAFAYGTLLGLQDLGTPQADLLDDVTFISSVSGGSLTAAYYGLHGRDGLRDFRHDVLQRNLELRMRLSALRPENLIRLLRGGLNDRHDMEDLLDREIFRGATFADMYRRGRPDVWINASDVYNRVPFPFIPPVFASVCSDLASLPISEAVSASMAVPLVFAPVIIKPYPDSCRGPLPAWVDEALNDPGASKIVHATAQAVSNYRNPQVMRYIKLADGGLTDNYGLSSILISRAVAHTPYGPLTAGDAVRMRNMLFLVVDAGRGLGGDWALEPEGPSGVDAALAATDTAVDSAARLGLESFQRAVREWQDGIVQYRCSLTPAEAAKLGAKPGWDCHDVHIETTLVSFQSLAADRAGKLNAIPTRLALPRVDIDLAVEGGRDALKANPALREYLQRRHKP